MEHKSEQIVLLGVVLLLYLMNFHCLSPGMGGRTDRDANGDRPVGHEYEIYLGYPAYYLAELWRTDSKDRRAVFSRFVAVCS